MNRFVVFLLTLFTISCTAQEIDKIDMTLDSIETKTYLALGDSYTIGQSVSEAERWPVLLVNSLNKRGYNFDAPRIIAKTGWTTDELDAAIKSEDVVDKFDLVTLLIGVNNQYRGRDVEEFRQQFRTLLEKSIFFAEGNKTNVIVLSIPDWGVSPFAAGKDTKKISEEINAFNAVKKEETQKKGVRFVDISDISRLAKDHVDYIAKDGLHFSGSMHQLWVDEVVRLCF